MSVFRFTTPLAWQAGTAKGGQANLNEFASDFLEVVEYQENR